MGKYLNEYWLSEGSGRTRRERQSGTYHPYLPDALSTQEFYFHSEVVAAVSTAESAIRDLNSAVEVLTNTEPLARLVLRAEALASSRIEGLELGAGRLLKEEALSSIKPSKQATPRDRAAAEVLNSIHMMDAALNHAVIEESITIQTICSMHQRLLEDTSQNQYAGRLRTEQNWTGGNSYSPIGADYVPPTPAAVPGLLEDLVAYCNLQNVSPVIKAAIAHAQFETIHPFVDGNGRVGRALIHLILRRSGIASNTVPPISLVLSTMKQNYVSYLDATRYDGSIDSNQANDSRNEWVEFFAHVCQRACADAQAFEHRIARLRAHWQSLVVPRKGSTVEALLGLLPGIPVITINTAAAATGRSVEATRLAVEALTDAGILTQSSSNRRNRVFEALSVIDEFTAYERGLATLSGFTTVEKPVRRVPRRRG
ncbi:MAG: Fic family protein [Coriobacteriales bacterium]|jgi:Fic family protein|nr:Fic family protein [Coriobacteriales bacterium]